ncbi:hypothetical protein AZO1586I_778 [Bathymodiolus thermophilus thioautotrophic gill symbiont]|jgi:outer membrane protein TolC|uniref:[weak similarity to] Outer membrane effluxprotein n=2 Tax=sulfur-oxidizing symbionts TaxID=32036 RepID=A0A1H6L1F7_9GAMM|nr:MULTISPECIES: TolC family protein [sulfur-oxidizing symbionts]CAC5824994.1 hypothetical protein [uncultured Gammaproteobacteria bacterium]CAB5501256.1 hypothetical protein AZO1586I_778 [Bathymodiolus thermophilus thioautotrophic gill symbiont]CAC9981228.1 hypothetical protein [uncultured Gammaproteobacteria bacterium]CAC9996290.1 hypothetical protein [uncultured Gammaproteobacteria bacterium]SEH82057.1 [weak similarity to] Outer membrane effluxprotein [Bathymodiolus azoricus thioautotrophic
MTVLLGPLNVQALTEQGFVERLRTTHPFFNQQALSSKVKLIEKRATKANEDWVIALESLYQSDHKNSGDISTTTSNLDTASIGLSATRKYTNTGSDITLKHTWKDKSKSTDTTNNGFSLDYTYPLLRNKGGINDRLSGDVAQIAINQNTLQRLEVEEGFILGKLSRFIDLAYAQEQQSINERRLALSEKELALVKKKYNASVVEKVDVLLQQDAYQTANQKLLQAQQDLMLLRHEIAVTLDLDFEKVVASTDFYKIYKPSEIALKAYLSKNSRVLKINNLSQKILKRQLLSFKNTAKAKLDLKLGISSAGENTNYSKSLSNQSTTWKVGLGLSYPIGGIEADSNIKKTNIELEILVQSKREQLLDIYTQAKTLKEKIQLLEKMMHANQAQIKIAKARTAEEKQRYSNGNGQASFVINAQNNEQVVKLSYAQVAKNYQKAILEFKASIDQLVP